MGRAEKERLFSIAVKIRLEVGNIWLNSLACEKNHKFELARFLGGG